MRLKKMTRLILFVIGFVGLFIYTMAFPGTLSWFVLLFYSLVAGVVWLSTAVIWRQITVTPRRVRLLSLWPLLIPTLTVHVENKVTAMSAFLRWRFDLETQLPRGHYDTVRIETVGADFFGFFHQQSKRKIAVDIDIYPEIVPLYKLSNHPEIRRYLKVNAPEIRQIRDYMFQDPMKNVDWKASFRRDKLMVKEYEKESEPRLHLIFIGYQSPMFEQLLSVAYSALIEWQSQLEVRMDLIGGDSFLTIEPNPDKAALFAEWQQMDLKHGKAIVFAQEALVEELRTSRQEPFLIVTEAGEAQ